MGSMKARSAVYWSKSCPGITCLQHGNGLRPTREPPAWTECPPTRSLSSPVTTGNGFAQPCTRAPIRDLRRYVIGWLNYFGHSRSYNKLVELDHWLRRRVRLCYWKQWKRPRTRRRNLLALGAKRDEVKLASRSRKGYWRMSSNRILQQALTNQRLWDRGVPNMRQQWINLHYGPANEQALTAGTARCGPACRGGVGGGS